MCVLVCLGTLHFSFRLDVAFLFSSGFSLIFGFAICFTHKSKWKFQLNTHFMQHDVRDAQLIFRSFGIESLLMCHTTVTKRDTTRNCIGKKLAKAAQAQGKSS